MHNDNSSSCCTACVRPILFLGLIALTLFIGRDFYIQIQTNRQLNIASARAQQQDEGVRRIADALRGVSSDLIDLAETSSVARRIIEDFGIRRQEPAEGTDEPSLDEFGEATEGN